MNLKISGNEKLKEKTFASFGEIMLRLSPPGHERFLQSPRFDASFGGGEANVAASLAIQGASSRFITALPDNDLGRGAERFLKGFGVDTGKIAFVKNSRLGAYFMEKGANQRPSKVIYDRGGSAMAEIPEGLIDWGRALEGCAWFHITGITPALSRRAADESLAAMRKARDLGLAVSCDLNYRAKLWNYGVPAREVMRELASLSHIVIANEEDCQKSLGIGEDIDPSGGEIPEEGYRSLTDSVLEQFPNLLMVAITLRGSFSASRNRWGACINDGTGARFSRKYDITDIVDRVGSGDSFCAGLIYGLAHYATKEEALEYAAAASALAHSVEGDVNLSTREEIADLCGGDAAGRIKR